MVHSWGGLARMLVAGVFHGIFVSTSGGKKYPEFSRRGIFGEFGPYSIFKPAPKATILGRTDSFGNGDHRSELCIVLTSR